MENANEKSTDIKAMILSMADQISSLELTDPLLIGIHTGGVWIAEQLHKILGYTEQMGTLDISFYRDDFGRVGLNPEVKSSELPSAVENRNIILIDDVLYSGRTIRAAMNEIFSYGRPKIVKLGVLIDRSGRELPIQPDIIGCTMDLDESQQAKLTNIKGNLELNVITTGNNA